MLIGELAAATGVKTKTLRYYEDEGLLQEPPAPTPATGTTPRTWSIVSRSSAMLRLRG